LIDLPRLRYVFRASNYDAGLVLITAFATIFIGIEFSILTGVALSILLFIPRAAGCGQPSLSSRQSESSASALRQTRGARP
jgi:MFS superfamily sulfate permease-like transporter